MKKTFFFVVVALLVCSCEKGKSDPSPSHQPENPATWSPKGHVYLSIDNDTLDGRYRGWTITFDTKDTMTTFDGQYGHTNTGRYRLEYPKIYIGTKSTTAWYKFIDTLTITRNFEASDCPTYKMIK